ncbi:MAG: hypothetical protein A2Z37_16415 [Chloroflexi bacterium RBG_19FT_COMBO_62_14]|nr:MAG: hypothetical protein A2Z37_16415 [Chloroflexi bacterium RBG_19FT_COMBO_62_14]
MAAIYKVSYVVTGEDHPGAILNVDHMPEVGEKVELGRRRFVVVEVFELVPPRGEFHFLHATLAADDE